MSRRSTRAIVIIACAAVFAIAAFEVVRYTTPGSRPLGEDPRVEFAASGFSDSARQNFLDGDFKIVTDVRGLPDLVVRAFTESGGSRLLIANPGERFEATDVIQDASVPRKRLIFAGVAEGRCFVHYAQGGRGLMYVVEYFEQTPTESMKPLWRGSCQVPAANIQELRRCVSKSEFPVN